jgi:hypothetical protein
LAHSLGRNSLVATGDRAFGVVAVDGDLAVADLAQGAAVLALHAGGGLALLGEAGVVDDEGGIALGVQLQHGGYTLAVEVVLVPAHGGEQPLEGLLGGVRDDGGYGVAVLVGVLGQHPGEVALQGVGRLGAGEVDVERTQELFQLRHRLRRRQRYSFGGLHTPLYARPLHLTKPY